MSPARNEQAKLGWAATCSRLISQAQHKPVKNLWHDRYKDLTFSRQAFRFSKTVGLEMRPIYVQPWKIALVVMHWSSMLAYRLVHELARRWQTNWT